MNLQEQYKRLFKGRVATTDKKILSESEADLQTQYDKVYKFTDSMGDEALEIIWKVVDQEGAGAELDKWSTENLPLSSTEESKLIEALREAWFELKSIEMRSAKPSSSPTTASSADIAYGKIYQFTDSMGDEALEIMDEILTDAGLFDLHQKHMDEKPLSSSEEKQLADIYDEIAGELEHGG